MFFRESSKITRWPILFLFLFLTPCKPLPKITDPSGGPTDIRGRQDELQVVFYSPQDEAESANKVVVSFNLPIVERPDSWPSSGRPPFFIHPQTEGVFRWIGAKTVVFETSLPLRRATNFRVKIPKALQSLSGRVLGKDFEWTFQTSPPRVLKVIPQNGTTHVSRDQKIYLVWNQPVSPVQVKTFGQLIVGKNPIMFDAREASEEEAVQLNFPQKNTVVIEPKGLYPMDSLIRLVVHERVKGLEGTLNLGQSFETTFTVYGGFKLKGIECLGLCPPKPELALYFTNPVDEGEFLSKVDLEPVGAPIIEVGWREGEKYFFLKPELKPQGSYTLTIPSDLKDIFGQRLGYEVQFDFSTDHFPPELKVPEGFVVLSQSGSRQLEAWALNIADIRIRASFLSPEAIIRFMSKKNSWTHENDPFADRTPDYEWMMRLEPNDEWQKIPISIDDALTSRRTGHILLDITSPQESSIHVHHRVLLQMTDFAIQREEKGEKTEFSVIRIRDGRLQRGAKVVLLDGEGKVLALGPTDRNYYVLAQMGEDRALMEVAAPTPEAGGARGLLDQRSPLTSDVNKKAEVRILSEGITDHFERLDILRPKHTDPSQGGLHLSVAPSILFPILNIILEIDQHPYHHLEAVVSKGGAALWMKDMMDKTGPAFLNEMEVKSDVTESIEKIVSAQDKDGSFRFWPESREASPLLTTWVMDFLHRATAMGYTVPQEVLSRARNFLKASVESFFATVGNSEFRDKIESLYALWILGEPMSELVEKILPHWEKLSGIEKARLVEILYGTRPDHPLIAAWLQDLQVPHPKLTMAAMLTTLLVVRPNHPLIHPLVYGLVHRRDHTGPINTYESGHILASLYEYYLKKETVPGAMRAMIQRGETSFLEADYRRGDFRVDQKVIPLEELKSVEPILFRKEGEGWLSYRAELRYLPEPDQEFYPERGIALSKEILHASGPVNQAPLKKDQPYTVRLTLVAFEDSSFVMIEDPLPSGFELSSSERDGGSFKEWLTHREEGEGSLIIAADKVPKGLYDFTYEVTPTITGKILMPPAKAFEIYNPKTYAQKMMEWIVVE